MRIVVAMSGGVDSSVAAALLVRQGHEVIGLSMQLYDVGADAAGADPVAEDRGGADRMAADRVGADPTRSAGPEPRSFGTCCTLDDLHDARRVAARIGIPHYIVNFEREFADTVISNFVSEYAAGRTPIPRVHCNGPRESSQTPLPASGNGGRLTAAPAA